MIDADAPSLLVVGGGILGTMHAVEGVRRGHGVVQIDRHREPRGASVRNFGLIWVSGRAPGPELDLALRARERWEEIALVSPAIGFRPSGSLTVATSGEEFAVLEAAMSLPDATLRGFELLGAHEARMRFPALGTELAGALFCGRDAIVEPRAALGALREYLSATGSYQFIGGREVVGFGDHEVVDERGDTHHADRVVICPGVDPGPGFRTALDGAPIRSVRLQMLETEPCTTPIGVPIADGNTLRYYPAFTPVVSALPVVDPIAEAWGAQLLLAQRLDGHLTIGDTHQYVEPFAFDLSDTPTEYLLGRASLILGFSLPPVERRWEGIYSEVTDPRRTYYRADLAPGVVVVTGPGGRGMTLSPAIAEETFL